MAQEISATLVMKLRTMSGQGMMDCKNALVEANGDLDRGMEILRKKRSSKPASTISRKRFRTEMTTGQRKPSYFSFYWPP